MGVCGDCRFWQGKGGQSRAGLCPQLSSIRHENGDRILMQGEPSSILDSPVWTDLEFGCIQFEPKD